MLIKRLAFDGVYMETVWGECKCLWACEFKRLPVCSWNDQLGCERRCPKWKGLFFCRTPLQFSMHTLCLLWSYALLGIRVILKFLSRSYSILHIRLELKQASWGFCIMFMWIIEHERACVCACIACVCVSPGVGYEWYSTKIYWIVQGSFTLTY